MTGMQKNEIRNHLLQGLTHLDQQGRVESFAVENCPDETDFASQLAQQGLNMTVERRRLTRLHELEIALQRLCETDYGVCEECGEDIGIARLKANPSARLCVICQSEVEEDVAMKIS